MYPYHPLFGEDYEVFGAAGGKRDMIYIRLPDKSSKGVPAWMFDPAICGGVRLEEEPVIDCGALSRLAQWLDSVGVGAPTAEHEPTTGAEADDNVPSTV